MNQYIQYSIIAVFLLVFPLLFLGIINRVKANWAGRKGASVFQPFFDVVRLLRKEAVISETSSFVLAMAPSVSLASLLVAAIVIPVGNIKPVFSFSGDFIFFAGFLGLSKFMIVLNAMDTGSSFEGMGASREVSFTALVEPAFYIIIASIAYLSGLNSLSDILIFFQTHGNWSAILIVLAATALFIMLLVEGCRIPVDDPNTHLELTMIHEVMVLDNSGPDLAFITYSAGLKMYLIASLIASLIIQPAFSIQFSTLVFVAVICGVAMLVGIVESLRPRLRMIHVPEFALLMLSVSLLICAGVVIYITGGSSR